MKMNACSNTIRIWKMAQIEPATTWPTKPNAVAVEPSKAMSRNSSSPAYMLPNRHAQRHGLGNEFNDIEQQVERRQLDTERRCKQFMNEAAQTFDLDTVIQHQCQHTQCNAEGAIQIGSRNNAVMHFFHAEQTQNTRDQINRQEVQRVHQEHPNEYGQRQRSNEAAVAVHHSLGLIFHHLDDHFNERLKTARHASISLACRDVHQQATDHTAEYRPENGIHIDDRKIDNLGLVLRR